MERPPHAWRDAEQALDIRILALQLLVDIVRVDTLLLRLDRGELHPFDDGEPFVVAVPDGGRERLLRDPLRQNEVIIGIGGAAGAGRGETRGVIAVDIATSR